MSKLLLMTGTLVFTASIVMAGPKCDAAKKYLDPNKENLAFTFNLENSNQRVKFVQQTGIERLGVLSRAIERNHEFLCGFAMTRLQEDLQYVEKNLQ